MADQSLGYLLALGAAGSFALGTVLQQRGTLDTTAPEGDPRFLAELVTHRVWLVGAGCQAVGWVLQAIALALAPLVAVQSLCALSLVLALPLGHRITAQVLDRRSIGGACLTLVGIVLFLVVGRPEDSGTAPTATAWWIASAIALGCALGLGAIGRTRRGPVAAVVLAGGAGTAFAYQAAATKAFTTEVGQGVLHLLVVWPTYALIVSALAGFALQQSALKTGHLAAAMGSSNAVTLMASVALGAWLFGEALVAPGDPLAPVLAGLALAVAGIGLLAGSGSASPS